jgi:hypothetical protein
VSDRTIRTIALVVIGLACAVCMVIGAKYRSVSCSALSAWLAFTLVVETWPRKDDQ